MDQRLLIRLEQAIRARRPQLAEALQPGLSEGDVHAMFSQAGISGDTGALVVFYSWCNGMAINSAPETNDSGFFPDSSYLFLDLSAALEHFAALGEAARTLLNLTEDPTAISQNVDHYFPLFWDSITSYLAMGLEPTGGNRVAIIDFEAEKPFHVVYDSFELFIIDAIRANEQNQPLSCFLSE